MLEFLRKSSGQTYVDADGRGAKITKVVPMTFDYDRFIREQENLAEQVLIIKGYELDEAKIDELAQAWPEIYSILQKYVGEGESQERIMKV